LGNAAAVGVACALRPRKQLEHLFRAVQALCESVPHVFVAGAAMPGDEAYAEQLLADGKRRLGDRLHVLGHLKELRDLYNGLDVFVNTSQEEACSISVIESLACGCPVIGYASKSVDDQVLPQGGEIVAQDDVTALSTRLHAWLGDSMRLSERRELARARAEDCFDIGRLSDQLWREYEEVLAARNVGRVGGFGSGPAIDTMTDRSAAPSDCAVKN
jgi:glycosyltransferase involved in cell wall biosynthesis